MQLLLTHLMTTSLSGKHLKLLTLILKLNAKLCSTKHSIMRRQQASAIISAREKIVEGAVSMVKMALDKLKCEGVVDLDEERKAAMVSNLLVVLCGEDNAQPVVNTSSLY